MTLENRVAVITGAAGGLGSVVTRDLAAQGARLALLGRSAERLESLKRDLALPEARLLIRTADLLNPSEAKSAAEAVTTKFGKIDILLHLVGGWTGGKTLTEVPAEDVTVMLDQHLWTTFHSVRAFLPEMVKNGWGRVVVVSSPFASRPAARGGPYAIGKAAQEALMLTLSQELKGSGVTANMLLVKSIDTKAERQTHPSPENASWTTPEELSAAILYLLSEETGTLNGARIPMYSGFKNKLPVSLRHREFFVLSLDRLVFFRWSTSLSIS